MKNLEFKAKCRSLAAYRQRLVNLKAEYRRTMVQIDTYFSPPKGRLKLREVDNREACLVYYERPDITDSRYSHYQICDIPNPTALKQIMSMVLGVKVVVEKQRELWVFGNTRIHLDEVVSLGEFVELETVISDQAEADAQTEHQLVKDVLGIQDQDLVSGSYSDLHDQI